ncbi:Hypothetical predicted protein [Cloeon dipterum]|uniref:RING-type domain-containing protein n=1 Tax=Cloeon dipterum TaxID=197152 RepID=A0A8S1BYH9_9INSE|nr:Hypothetical predicted protein [Cloeon dipterum]
MARSCHKKVALNESRSWNGDEKRPLVPSNTLEKLNLHISIHRYLTFPMNFCEGSPSIRVHLANAGLYMSHDERTLFCAFCDLKINHFDHLGGQDISTEEDFDDVHQQLSKDCPLYCSDETENILFEPSKVLDYRFEAFRLFSLLNANWVPTISPYDLAHSGFYYVGDLDNCRCCFCKLEVRGWELGDVADMEHRRWFPNCPFMTGKLVGNVKIGDELSPASSSTIQRPMDQANPFIKSFRINPYPNLKLNIRKVTLEGLGIRNVQAPKYPNYSNYNTRLMTYKLWPKSLEQTPEILAAAGFFYTKTGDQVVCHYCGIGLKSWAPHEDPLTEHVSWEPRCEFVMMSKGADFVKNILNSAKIHASTAKAQLLVRSKTSSIICKSCNQATANIVNLSCGHIVTCSTCADKTPAKKCATCSARVLATLLVYPM